MRWRRPPWLDPLVIHTLLIVVALAAQPAQPDYDVRAAIVGRWTADKLSMIESMPEYRSIQQEAARNGSMVEDEVEAEFIDHDTLTLMKKGERLTFRLTRVAP